MPNGAHLTLAEAEPGERLEVDAILFQIVRDRCSDLGIERGTALTCTRNREGGVAVRLPDGRSGVLERHYAWFVQTTRLPSRVRSAAG